MPLENEEPKRLVIDRIFLEVLREMASVSTNDPQKLIRIANIEFEKVLSSDTLINLLKDLHDLPSDDISQLKMEIVQELNEFIVSDLMSKLLPLIKEPLITEKATFLLEDNKYCFTVDCRMTKPEIKFVIENFFGVEVKKVNTMNLPERTRTIGRYRGKKPRYKKAIVTLKSGEIVLFPDV